MEVRLSEEISSPNELKITPHEKQDCDVTSLWLLYLGCYRFKVKKNLVSFVSGVNDQMLKYTKSLVIRAIGVYVNTQTIRGQNYIHGHEILSTIEVSHTSAPYQLQTPAGRCTAACP